MLNAEYRTSTVSLLDALKWQSIEKRLSYQYCIMAYKSLNDMGPPYLSHLLSRRNVVYSTRHVESNQLYLPIPKTENKKRSFSYKASKLFNSLPLHVQSSSTLEVFKKRLRAHQYTCWSLAAITHDHVVNHYLNYVFHSLIGSFLWIWMF